MEYSTLLLVVCNFILIGLLPRIFFKKGRLTLMWLVTAWPYMASPIVSSMVYAGYIPLGGWVDPSILQWAHFLVVPLCIVSMGIIFMTIGTHRVPLALWHQDPNDDAPKQIVTWGTYKYVRHPFYVAFILAAIANCILVPTWINFLLGLYIFLILNFTASKEEKRLSSDSQFGNEYRDYLAKTNRFIPLLF